MFDDAYEPPPKAAKIYMATTAHTREQAFTLAVHAWLGCAIMGPFVMT